MLLGKISRRVWEMNSFRGVWALQKEVQLDVGPLGNSLKGVEGPPANSL